MQNEINIRESIFNASPKTLLDSNVAIGSVLYVEKSDINFKKGFTYRNCSETGMVEAFFRGIDIDLIRNPSEDEGEHFFPAKYPPLPWWETIGKQLFSLRPIDGMVWMSPYGKAYYLPAFLLTSLPGLTASVLYGMGKEPSYLAGRVGFAIEVIESLLPPKELSGVDIWNKVSEVSLDMKNPLNKKRIYTMHGDERFLIFLSKISDEQKKAIGLYAQYALDTWYKKEKLYPDDSDEIKRLKACWLE